MFTADSTNSTNQTEVLTSWRVKYVKGWSLVAAKSTISVKETMVHTALTMRRTMLVLFGHDVSGGDNGKISR